MGFDTSATKSIFFIASVIVAVTLSGIFTGVAYRLSSDIDERSSMLSGILTSSIDIINDPEKVPYNATTGELILYIKNTGKSILNPFDLSILVDGLVIPDNNITIEVLDPNNSWGPGVIVKVTLTVNLSSGDHKVKVVLKNGISDEMYFRI